jgi:hypothetical protein
MFPYRDNEIKMDGVMWDEQGLTQGCAHFIDQGTDQKLKVFWKAWKEVNSILISLISRYTLHIKSNARVDCVLQRPGQVLVLQDHHQGVYLNIF